MKTCVSRKTHAHSDHTWHLLPVSTPSPSLTPRELHANFQWFDSNLNVLCRDFLPTVTVFLLLWIGFSSGEAGLLENKEWLGVWIIEGEKMKLETMVCSSHSHTKWWGGKLCLCRSTVPFNISFFSAVMSLLQTSYAACIPFPWRGQLSAFGGICISVGVS